MSLIAARLRSGQDSRAESIRLYIDGETLVLQQRAGSERISLSSCQLSDRLADLPRVISLPDGRLVEVADNAALDAQLLDGGQGDNGLIHRIESHIGAVLIAAIATGLLLWWFFDSGVPQLADSVAQRLPPAVEARIGDQVLQGMAQHPFFTPSTLSEERRTELLSRFAGMSQRHALTIHFFEAPRLGANAFALPGGHIIVTDGLVALSKHDEEILAVLAHEAGHAVNHHPLRALLSSSITALLLTALLGDASALTGVLVAAPTILIDSAYSRQLEREADDYALAWMHARGIDSGRFADILERMSVANGGGDSGFLSSHPAIAERARKARTADQSAVTR